MDQGDSLSLEGTVQGKLNSLQFVTQCPYAQGKHEMGLVSSLRMNKQRTQN